MRTTGGLVAVVMLALGSRGDVQPSAVLAGALGELGIEVRIVALAEYADLVAHLAPRATFVGVPTRLEDAFRRGGSDEVLARGAAGQLVLLRRWLAGLAALVVDAALGAVRAGDVVLSGVLTRGLASALAAAFGCRAATVVFTGLPPTLHRDSHAFGSWFSGWAPYDTWGVRLNWALATSTGQAVTRAARRTLGLSPLGLRETAADADRHPTIVAASPLLVPPAPDWAAGVHQTGFLAAPEPVLAPDPALEGFLAEGPAVSVGFGSLTGFTTDAEFDLLVAAADRAGRRLVVPAVGGMPPGPVGRRVYAHAPVPHRWLFRRVAGVVHAGGSGTTHEGLLAGVPSVVVPFGTDQPYHGRRLRQLGVGPAPLPVRRLTSERLARIVDDLVASPAASEYRRRAAEVGAAIRVEDGVGRTVALFDRLGYL